MHLKTILKPQHSHTELLERNNNENFGTARLNNSSKQRQIIKNNPITNYNLQNAIGRYSENSLTSGISIITRFCYV